MSKLKELMESEIQLKMPVMVGNISQKEDKTGAPYLMVDLIDGESVITARIFKTDKANCVLPQEPFWMRPLLPVSITVRWVTSSTATHWLRQINTIRPIF